MIQSRSYLSLVLVFLMTTMSSCLNNSTETNTSKENLTTSELDTPAATQTPKAILSTDTFQSTFNIHDLFLPGNTDVVNTIANQNYSEAAKKAEGYLQDSRGRLTETQKANLRYMHVYALAGLVTQRKKTHEDVGKVLKSYEGLSLITQHLEITQGNAMPFNQIQEEQDDTDTLTITCANDAGVNIHCFVRAGLKERVDLKGLVGKRAFVCGRLAGFKLSDRDVVSWIMDLRLRDGFIKVLEDGFGG
jgi:hypothetical protein